ncbi:MAG: YkgJ family cysteine cluster protein [Cyclobacteriaceae bacterium]
MSLEEKVSAVERVFEALDREIAVFQNWSELHCPAGCGKCCFKADIEATILEFLPFANYLYKNRSAMKWLERLQTTNSTLCLILNPTQAGQGLCSEYKYRGLICRLFGYSARTNKYGRKELVTCEIVKGEESFARTSSMIEAGEKNIPVMSQYYMQLHAIDIDLTRNFYPINVAIRKAIEIVLHHYSYRQDS